MFTSSTANSSGNNINMMTFSSNRPATGLRSANYTGYSTFNGGNFLNNYSIWRQIDGTAGAKSRQSNRFDPLNQRNSMQLVSAANASRDPLAAIISKERQTVYDRMKQLEKVVHELVESSCIVASRGEYKLALIKAKDAQAKMSALKSVYDKNLLLSEQSSPANTPQSEYNNPQQEVSKSNLESMIPLTNGVNINENNLMVTTNLALQYLNNGQLNQALDIYNELNNQSSSSHSILDSSVVAAGATADKVAARFGINLANEYFRQGLYQRALKYYRLTLDRISSNDYNSFRIKVMCNIGLTFIKSQQYTDAITAYNHIMTDNINPQQKTTSNVHHHQCGLHLILCNYMIKDKDCMKIVYQKLIESNLPNHFDDLLNKSTETPSDSIMQTTMNTSMQDLYMKNQRRESSTAHKIMMADSNKTTSTTGSGIRTMMARSESHQLDRQRATARRIVTPASTANSHLQDAVRYSSASDIIGKSSNSTGTNASINSFSAAATIFQKLDTSIESGSNLTRGIDDLDGSAATLSFVRNAIRNDSLHKLIKAKVNQVQRSIIMGAKLIAKLDDVQPADIKQQKIMENNSRNQSTIYSSSKKTDNNNRQTSTDGRRTASSGKQSINESLDYCVGLLQNSKYFNGLISDLEISKATRYIDKQQFDRAIDTLKMMEASGKANQNSRSSSMAATNLSLLYSLKNEFVLASTYAEQSISIDPFNANAYVNLGNSLYFQRNYEHAEICYKKAIEVDINCLEAHYNLVLLYRTIKQNDKSLASLMKLESSMKTFHPLIVQEIKVYVSIGDGRKSLELLDDLMNVAPRDPTLLIEMSELAEKQSDYSTIKILTDAYKCLPSHIKTLERLVAVYIDGGAYEKAIEILAECVTLRPDQDKWPMMIAACHRRSGDYHQALNSYRMVHSIFPDNTSCLKSLIQLCNDLGLEEAKLYETKLNKVLKRSSAKNQPNQPLYVEKSNLSDTSPLSSDRNEPKENVVLGTNNNLYSSSSFANGFGSRKSRILEEDLLKIPARPSTSERRKDELYEDSEHDDLIINVRS